MVEIVIREALKLGLQNHYLDGIPALFAASDLLQNPVLEKFTGENKRSKIGRCSTGFYHTLGVAHEPVQGLLLKSKSVHFANSGSHWGSSLLFSLVQELHPCWDHEKDEFDGKTIDVMKVNIL